MKKPQQIRASIHADTPLPPLNLRLFGAFSLAVHGQEVPGLSRAVQELLALLALNPDSSAARETLAQTLWPDAERERALFYLRRSLSELRAALGAEKERIAAPTRQTLRFDLAGAECDVLTFDRLASRQDVPSLEQATACYRGPLLESCGAAWALPERVRRQERYVNALMILADHRMASGELSGAARLLRRAAEADPLREATSRRLMQVLGESGDHAGVEKQYRQLRKHLHDELNMEPSVETTALHLHLRSQARTALPSPDIESCVPANRQFPCPLTSLVGRTRDREAICDALRATRLVTLTGPGGVGKTRLALAVAEAVAQDYPDGVTFADLAPAADRASVLQAVAASLGTRQDTASSPEEVLRHFLCRKRLLLILDNAEHVLTVCAHETAFLLRECPSLSILCTSREPLRVAGEHNRPVAPLPTPPALPKADYSDREVSGLLACESAALLVERASAASAAFRLTPRNAAAIAQICRRLDGIPLALELAAARFRSLSAQEIAARLEESFRLLCSGDPSLPRHRTLRAALEWSYGLLNEAEQRLLRRLTVFVGGWTLAAAEAICPAEAEAVVPLLLSLVEKSLVVYDVQEDRERYRLLEMTRAYAAELLEADERAMQRERHAAFFLHVAQGVNASGVEFHARYSYTRIEAELANLRAAREWWQERNHDAKLWLEYFIYFCGIEGPRDWRDRIAHLIANPLPPSPLALLVSHQTGCWAMWTGHPSSEILLLRVAEMASECEESKWRLLALLLLIELAEEQGKDVQALDYAHAALRSAREHGDVYHIVRAETLVCRMLARTGAAAEAYSRLHVQLDRGRRDNDWRILLSVLDLLGEMAFERQEWDKARACWEELLSITRLRQPSGLPNRLRSLAGVAREMQDYPSAWHYLEQGITASRHIRALDREGWTRWDMAEVAFRQGDIALALEQLRLGLGIFQDNEEARSVAQCLRKAALFHKAGGRCEQAALLLGNVETRVREQSLTMSDKEQNASNDLAAALRDSMGEEAWRNAFARGQTLDFAQAEALAFFS